MKPDASDGAYLIAWARFAALADKHGPIQAGKLLRSIDPEAFHAMMDWMERQVFEERERLRQLMNPEGRS